MTDGWQRSRRDQGVTALIEGFFAAAWFGWGQAKPPPGLSAVLATGSVVAILTAVAGAVLTFRLRSLPAIMDDPSARRRYRIIVGAEFAVAALGALVLAIAGQPAYIPVWVCAVVGIHFFSLAPLLRDRSLYPLGILVCAASVVALIVGLTTNIAPSAITGVGAGWLLTVFALFNLVAGAQITPKSRTLDPPDR